VNITIPGNKLEKGLDVSFSVGVGRVPMPVQSSLLYADTTESQTLIIFMDYDAFTDNIALPMLTFGGVMSEFEVIGLELVNHKTIELTLTGGPSAPGTGTVRFDCAAVSSGRTGRTATIVVYDKNAQEDEPSEAPSGEPSGEPSEEEDDYTPLMASVYDNYDYSPLIVSAHDDYAPANLAAIAAAVAKFACTQAWGYGSAQIRKNSETGSFFSTLGLSGAEKETQQMLREISYKLDEMSRQVAHNDAILHAYLDRINYDIGAADMKRNLDTVDLLYNDFNRRAVNATLSAAAFDEWCDDNLRYSSSGNNRAKNYMDTLQQILKDLDPYTTDNVLKTAPLFLKYEQSAKSETPFEHNTFMVVVNYGSDWDAKIAGYMTLATTIVDYNRANANLSETAMENLYFDYDSLTQAVGRTFKNLENYIKKQPYAKAHDQFISISGGNKQFHVICNKYGKQYLFADRYHGDYETYRNNSTENTRKSQGFAAKLRLSKNDWKDSYIALDPFSRTPINGNTFAIARAANASTIAPPTEIATFMSTMSVTAHSQNMSFGTLLQTYLATFEKDGSQGFKIKKHWEFPNVKWIYSARTHNYRKSGSLYSNDRTLMIDTTTVVGSNGLIAHSVTCEDGLLKNKQVIKADDEIFILMIVDNSRFGQSSV
jgi:hypothetical protein